MKKKRSNSSGLVYSTDPNFNPDSYRQQNDAEENTSLPISQQNIKVKLDTKHRAGKAVTLIQGFEGKESDIEELAKKLKASCGTGGSVKNNGIIIQGDNREKILTLLQKQGYSKAKKV